MNKITEKLNGAVKTMRDACDQAQRAAAHGDAISIRRTLNALTWGHANAVAAIQDAMAELDRLHERAALATSTPAPPPPSPPCHCIGCGSADCNGECSGDGAMGG